MEQEVFSHQPREVGQIIRHRNDTRGRRGQDVSAANIQPIATPRFGARAFWRITAAQECKVVSGIADSQARYWTA